MKYRKALLALCLASTSALAASNDPDARAAATEAQMTDAERFHLLHSHLPITMEPGKVSQLIPGMPIVPGVVKGIARLGIPDILEVDASLGVVNPFELRQGDVATALPSSLALASSFDPDLAYRSGRMIAGEARAKGFNVLLAPGVNLTRDPRNGRNFEYLGEDPLLAGTLAGEASRGIESAGVVATIKHFLLNAQETQRFTLDAKISEAAMRESDLLAFQIGIERGQPGSVMCAYNRVNGPWSCGNDFLLNKVLKGDWGYKGWVMSDWGAVHDVSYFNAGLDQHSGAELDQKVWFDKPLQEEYAAGRVSRERLSDAVRRILRSLYAAGADGPLTTHEINYEENAKVAREAEASGIVLLKNDGVLPLANAEKSILVVGGYAATGVLAGGGSSQVTPVGGVAAIIPTEMHRLTNRAVGQALVRSLPLASLKAALPKAKIAFDPGYDTPLAAAKAAHADMVIVFATKWQTEGADTGDLLLPGGQNELISAIAKNNRNVLVVLETGNPVLMPWLADVRAVVEAWFPGQKGGEAIADVLAGVVNPSGRLPMSFPAAVEQLPRPALDGLGLPDRSDIAVNYVEGSDVGYRWYAAKKLQPLFPFGHGLSYTTFKTDGLKLTAGDKVQASVRVKNTGKREGGEVVQLYLVEAAGKPVQRLAAFGRVQLKPGKGQDLTLAIEPRLLADWNGNGWLIRAGAYKFALGKSAAELGPMVAVELKERHIKP